MIPSLAAAWCSSATRSAKSGLSLVNQHPQRAGLEPACTWSDAAVPPESCSPRELFPQRAVPQRAVPQRAVPQRAVPPESCSPRELFPQRESCSPSESCSPRDPRSCGGPGEGGTRSSKHFCLQSTITQVRFGLERTVQHGAAPHRR